MKRLLMLLPILLIFACGGKKKVANPAPNPAPPNLLLGTWNGTLNMTFPGPIFTQDAMLLTITSNAVALKLSGDSYAATLQSMADPNISFTADIFGFVQNFSGKRTDNIINGTATIPAVNATGTWSVTKQPVIAKIQSFSREPRLRDLLNLDSP